MAKDTYLINQIAWWVGGENCADDVTHKEYAARIIELVREHDKRLTKRAADGFWLCEKCGCSNPPVRLNCHHCQTTRR